jgi:hypothetical protein
MDNGIRVVKISNIDLEEGDISNFKRIFEQVVDVPKNAKLLRGKIVIIFPKAWFKWM